MRKRLLKDLRELTPFLLGAVIFCGLISPNYVVALLTLAAVGLGTQLVAHEHASHQISWLLAQPIPRGRIWLEKVLALLIAIGLLVCGTVLVGTGRAAFKSFSGDAPSLLIELTGFVPAELTESAISALPASAQHALREKPLNTSNVIFYGSTSELRQLAELTMNPSGAAMLSGPGIWFATWFNQALPRNGIPLIFLTDAQGNVVRCDAPLRFAIAIATTLLGMLVYFGPALGGLWFGIWLKPFFTAFAAALAFPLMLIVFVTVFWLPDLESLWIFAPIWGAVSLVASRYALRRLEV